MLFDDEGKQIGNASLTREDDEEIGQKVRIKKKDVFFMEGFKVVLGSKVVQVNHNIIICMISRVLLDDLLNLYYNA